MKRAMVLVAFGVLSSLVGCVVRARPVVVRPARVVVAPAPAVVVR